MNRISMMSGIVWAGLACGMAAGGDEEPVSPAWMDEQIEWVTIDDPGNMAYPGMHGMLEGRGSVDYSFRVSRTEITTGQWLEFLNIFGTMDDLGELLVPTIWGGRFDFNYHGPGERYVLTHLANQPELISAGVTWRQAAMFCNWMQNGHSDDLSAIFDGVYDTSTFTRNDDNTYNDQDTHGPDARYWIVTLDEYLKAVYYDPDKNGQGPGWWLYGHSSDEPPVYGMPGVGDVGRELSDEELIELCGHPSANYLPLGLYPEAQSPWGLLDVLGGHRDFVEDWEPTLYRRARADKLASNSTTGDNYPYDEVWFFNTRPTSLDGGFRIASQVRPRVDLNRDWDVNFFDVSRFVGLFFASDLAVDLDDDGGLDVDDVVAFLEMYRANVKFDSN